MRVPGTIITPSTVGRAPWIWGTAQTDTGWPKRERHGRPWTQYEIEILLDVWSNTDLPLSLICENMRRPELECLSKLQDHGLVKPEAVKGHYTGSYVVTDKPEKTKFFGTLPPWALSPGNASDSDSDNERVSAKPNPKPPTETKDEIMSNPNIETKTFIGGVDAVNLSDDQIFDAIAKVEKQIATLSGVLNKPKKLVAKIEALRDDVQALVDFVDSRG